MKYAIHDYSRGDEDLLIVNSATCGADAIRYAQRMWEHLSDHDKNLRDAFYVVAGEPGEDGDFKTNTVLWDAFRREWKVTCTFEGKGGELPYTQHVIAEDGYEAVARVIDMLVDHYQWTYRHSPVGFSYAYYDGPCVEYTDPDGNTRISYHDFEAEEMFGKEN